MKLLGGVFAFSLFIAFDYNKIKNGWRGFNLVFPVGILLLAGSTTWILARAGLWQTGSTVALGALLILFLLCFALLCYCLFFALPFGDTYSQSETLTVVDRGVYALCRHPGVWCLMGMYVCLCGLFPAIETAWMAIVFNGCNVLYVWWQDVYLFPKCLQGYDRYRKTTPFLIPNKKSIRQCWSDLFGQK